MFFSLIYISDALNDVAIPGYITAALPAMAAAVLPNNPANGIPVPKSEDPICGYFTTNISYVPCSREGTLFTFYLFFPLCLDIGDLTLIHHFAEYIRRIANLASSFVPSYTPSYSNANFAILGLALENMLKAPIQDIFAKSVAKPLGLTSTTVGNPRRITKHSVIPGGGLTRSGWDDALGPLNRYGRY